VKGSRKPEVMGDAAHAILTRKSTEYTGHFAIDEDVLRQAGISDLSTYSTTPGMKDSELIGDYFL